MSSSSSNLTKKYRPYFTLTELKALRDACLQIDQPELYKYLYRYVLDIESGIRQENHTLQPTIAQKLELTEPLDSTELAKLVDPKVLYTRWQSNQLITPAELAIVQQYRYEQDLMDPIQEAEYEAKQGIRF